MRNYLLFLALLALLLTIKDANARSYDTTTYQALNIGLTLKSLRVYTNTSFKDGGYHHGVVGARYRFDKHISVSYSYYKDEYTGNVSQSYAVNYELTLWQ